MLLFFGGIFRLQTVLREGMNGMMIAFLVSSLWNQPHDLGVNTAVSFFAIDPELVQ